ncbi:hypothetical protein D3C76_1178170 [compost metagenome]
MMHLYRELLPWCNRDALHLIARTMVNGVVGSPRAIHLTVIGRFGARALFDAVNQQFYVLRLVLGRNHHSVCGFDHNDVIQAQYGHHAMLSMNIGIAGCFEHDVAAGGIALGILFGDFPDCRP